MRYPWKNSLTAKIVALFRRETTTRESSCQMCELDLFPGHLHRGEKPTGRTPRWA